MNFTILRFDSLSSTNTEAANQARQGADEGVCVVAREQTAGRGRHGRTWVSLPDSGLYFSIILRPRLSANEIPLITLMAGVAVYDTLKELGLKPDIKWVNDILVGDKKISGILAETVETKAGTAVVVGIGINLKSGNFPDEIADLATSIWAEGAAPTLRDDLETSLAAFLDYWYEILKGEDGPAEIVRNWGTRSTYLSGKPVRVTLPNETFEGVTDGLERNGALRVRIADYSTKIVQAGDVERLRAT